MKKIKNLLRISRDFFVFFYEDIREDITTLSKVIDGTYKCKYTKEEMKTMFNIKDILKTYWPFIIILMGFFCAGWFLAAQYYQVQCNEIILANQGMQQLGAAYMPINITFPLN